MWKCFNVAAEIYEFFILMTEIWISLRMTRLKFLTTK